MMYWISFLQYQDSIEIVRRDGSSCSVLPQSQAYEGAAGAFIPAAGIKGLGHEMNFLFECKEYLKRCFLYKVYMLWRFLQFYVALLLKKLNSKFQVASLKLLTNLENPFQYPSSENQNFDHDKL